MSSFKLYMIFAKFATVLARALFVEHFRRKP